MLKTACDRPFLPASETWCAQHRELGPASLFLVWSPIHCNSVLTAIFMARKALFSTYFTTGATGLVAVGAPPAVTTGTFWFIFFAAQAIRSAVLHPARKGFACTTPDPRTCPTDAVGAAPSAVTAPPGPRKCAR